MAEFSPLIPLSGDWFQSWKYVAQDLTTDVVVYKLCYPNGAVLPNNSDNGQNWDITYTQSTFTWSDSGQNDPVTFSSSGDSTTGTSTVVNPLRLYGFGPSGNLLFEVDNPWYQAPNTNSEGSTTCHLTYDPVQNWMQAYLNSTLDSTDLVSTRNLYYRVINATTNTVVPFNMNHTSGSHTYLNFDPTVNGTYELQKVLTNPLEVLICDSAVVNTFPASDVPPENDPPSSPMFVTRSARRGNLNFW